MLAPRLASFAFSLPPLLPHHAKVIETILFASDFAPTMSKAERYAIDFARANSASITVIHVVEPIEGASEEAALTRFVARKQETARRQAETVAERIRGEKIEADVAVPIGKRWKAIIDHAKAGGYGLVVLGSHTVADGDKVYVGTTTQKVFFAADMPLLVVPS